MSRTWFAGELETVASFWRIYRRDGVTLGFTAHDFDLRFDDIIHRAAPGMVPSAIRLTAGLDADSAEVAGALDHASITAADLQAGRFDGAKVSIGLVDWETLENTILFSGSIGRVGQDDQSFQAELQSLKHALAIDPVPRTSPTCRAQFCGPGCNLSSARHSHEVTVGAIDLAANAVMLDGGPDGALLLDGWLRWTDGSAAGVTHRIAALDGAMLILEPLIAEDATPGARAIVREGCDHRFATCSARFGNATNFRGEPFLPGNDLLTRYPMAGR